MLFNSVDFAIFLPIVFVLFWFVTNKKLKAQINSGSSSRKINPIVFYSMKMKTRKIKI